MNVLRTFTLCWMLVCLPVAGTMANAMPLCAMGSMGALPATAEAAEPDGMHCDRHDDSGGQPACEHCDLCHLAGALMPPSLPLIGSPLPAAQPPAQWPADFTSFFPDLPPRPPALPQA